MTRIWLAAAALALSVGAQDVAGQVHVTALAGGYIPASDLRDLRDEAERRRLDREGTLGLGLNVEAGWLRGSVAYASGAKITAEGVENREQIGDGSVLSAALGVVVRPLPRVFAQPYVLGGVGLKRQDYSFNEDGLGTNPLPADRTDLALHAGVGVDLMLGGFGLVAEVTDFITREPGGGDWGQHDAFVMVGLRLRLGGS